ncbi:MAG: hypothetical protein J3K34DRAFT_430262, partial [Monoraphidium minutum]
MATDRGQRGHGPPPPCTRGRQLGRSGEPSSSASHAYALRAARATAAARPSLIPAAAQVPSPNATSAPRKRQPLPAGMDPIAVAPPAPAMDELASPTACKRSVELKRRSIDPAEFVPPTSAPKLHCTASAKLVDLMSNFNVLDPEAAAFDDDAARGSDCSDGDAAP